MKQKYEDVFNFLLPAIKVYYNSTNSLQDLIENTKSKCSSGYYTLLIPDIKVVLSFLKAFNGEKESAIHCFNKIQFKDETVKEKLLKKLNEIG